MNFGVLRILINDDVPQYVYWTMHVCFIIHATSSDVRDDVHHVGFMNIWNQNNYW